MSVVCPHCGIERETLETPCLICNHKPEPQDKAAQPGAAQTEGCLKDANPTPPPKPIDGNRTVKRVSLWVSVYGWLMLVYWLFDTLTFFSLLDTNPGESFIVWGYSCIRGAIGLSVIILASNIRKSPHRAVKLLGVVLGLLIFRAFMMMALDNAFFSFHVADLITGHSPERRSGVPGMGVLMMLIIYVWQTRRTLKQAPINVASRPEQKRQPIAETHGNHSTIKNVKDWIASNRTPCAMAVAVIVVASVALAFKPRDRFYMVTNADGYTYRIDKTTGQTWRIQGSRMTEVKRLEPTKAEPQKPLETLPSEEIAKLDGKAGISGSRDSISGTIYNGSNWDIKELTISVTGKTVEGNEAWTRQFIVGFYEPVYSPVVPLSVGKFIFEVGDTFANVKRYDNGSLDGNDLRSANKTSLLNFDWCILAARGHPSN